MLTCSIFLKWLCLFCYSNLLFFVAFNKIVKRFFCMWIASFFFVFLLLFVYLHSYARTAIKIFCVCIQIFFEKQNCKTMLTFIFMNAKSRSFIFYSHIYLNPNVSCRTFRKWINRIKLKHQYSWTNYFFKGFICLNALKFILRVIITITNIFVVYFIYLIK